ncbi:hypothetical protein Tco_0101614, partial [Tanacetum coccineum]
PSIPEQQYQLYLSMKNDPQLQQQDIAIWLTLQMKFKSLQRDPEAPPLSLINQDLLYLKKGSSGLEKIVVSLHKFPAIILNDDDIEE